VPTARRLGQQVALAALRDDPAAADDDQLISDHLDLTQQVRGQQHRFAAIGERAQQISRPVRPACWAEASSRTPTRRPGLGSSV